MTLKVTRESEFRRKKLTQAVRAYRKHLRSLSSQARKSWLARRAFERSYLNLRARELNSAAAGKGKLNAKRRETMTRSLLIWRFGKASQPGTWANLRKAHPQFDEDQFDAIFWLAKENAWRYAEQALARLSDEEFARQIIETADGRNAINASRREFERQRKVGKLSLAGARKGQLKTFGTLAEKQEGYDEWQSFIEAKHHEDPRLSYARLQQLAAKHFRVAVITIKRHTVNPSSRIRKSRITPGQ